MEALRRLSRLLPTLLTAFVLAVAIWISAVSAGDPTEESIYSRPVPIEVIGQDPGLIIVSTLPENLSLTIRAPQSTWRALRSDSGQVRALIDLAGLDEGSHTIDVQVQVAARPSEVVTYSPRTVSLTLERLLSKTMPIELDVRGEPAVGYQADDPELAQETVTVHGPQSLVEQVARVRAILDLSNAQQSIDRNLTLQPVDKDGVVVNGVSLSPEQVRVQEEITQRFGYRNVVVNAVVSGEPAEGYRLTNISVFPPVVTVYSPNPIIISNLPGYVSTEPIDLNNLRDDVDLRVGLDLPVAVSVVGGETEVLVRVSVAAIEASLTLENVRVQAEGLPSNLAARFSPETVTVILSGPVSLLDQLNRDTITATVDLTGQPLGTYQLVPEIEMLNREVQVESILPGTIEVDVITAPRPTATPRP